MQCIDLNFLLKDKNKISSATIEWRRFLISDWLIVPLAAIWNLNVIDCVPNHICDFWTFTDLNFISVAFPLHMMCVVRLARSSTSDLICESKAHWKDCKQQLCLNKTGNRKLCATEHKFNLKVASFFCKSMKFCTRFSFYVFGSVNLCHEWRFQLLISIHSRWDFWNRIWLVGISQWKYCLWFQIKFWLAIRCQYL